MKKNTIAALVSSTTAFALAATLAGCAPAPAPDPEPADEAPQIGIKLAVEAQGWDADTSTPVIAALTESGFEQAFVCNGDKDEQFATASDFEAHLDGMSDEEKQAHGTFTAIYLDEDGNQVEPETTYHELAANEDAVIEVEEGTYNLELISPINADGSIYAVPEDTEVTAGEITDDADAIELVLIPAEEATSEQLEGIVAGITLAVQAESGLGDESLIERAVANAAANPNVSAEDIEAAQDEAEAAVEAGDAQAVANLAATQPSRDASGNTSSKANTSAQAPSAPSNNSGSANNQGSTPAATPSAPSNSGNSNSGSSNGGASASTPAPAPSQPSHEHNWVPQTTQQWVVDVPGHSEIMCNNCKSVFASAGDYDAHAIATRHGGSSTITTPEQGHYETITTGYTCSCGATK